MFTMLTGFVQMSDSLMKFHSILSRGGKCSLVCTHPMGFLHERLMQGIRQLVCSSFEVICHDLCISFDAVLKQKLLNVDVKS